VLNLSPWAIAKLHACPEQFRRTVLLREEDKPGVAAGVGLAVQSALEVSYREEAMDEFEFRKVWDGRGADADRDRAHRLYVGVHGRLRERDVLGCEEWASYDSASWRISGRIDFATARSTIDVKTSRQRVSSLPGDWRRAGMIYCLLTGLDCEFMVASETKTYGVRVQTCEEDPFLVVRNTTTVRELAVRMIDDARELAQWYETRRGREKEWPGIVGDDCRWCPHRQSCRWPSGD
jgi:hypothetical protein